MTVVLGWKHAVVAAILVALAIGGAWFAIRQLQQRDVQDWERQQQIQDLQHKVEQAEAEIKRLRSLDEAAQNERDKLQQERDTAIAKYEGLRLIKSPTPEQKDELCRACQQAVELLKMDLALADSQVVNLRQQAVVLQIALEDTTDMYTLQTRRLQAAQRRQKQTKRRNVWTITSVAAASLTLGWGIGRL